MTRLGDLRKAYKKKFGKGVSPKWDEETILKKLDGVITEKINKQKTKANIEFKAGQTVRHKIKGDRFVVEEITEEGLVARKVNARDPFVLYKPQDLYAEELED